MRVWTGMRAGSLVLPVAAAGAIADQPESTTSGD